MEILIGDPLYRPFKNYSAIHPQRINQDVAPEKKELWLRMYYPNPVPGALSLIPEPG